MDWSSLGNETLEGPVRLCLFNPHGRAKHANVELSEI